MSIITLQFGQCGNQIGQALYSELHSDIKTDPSKTGIGKRPNVDYINDSINRWFHVNKNGLWEVRSILIDTENKVTSGANSNGYYKFKNVVAKAHGGAANNWAYGYSSKSSLLMNDIVDGIRKEMEKSDHVSSIIYLLSSAGGTGSGVGSKTIEVLRDECPTKTIIGNIVLPYRSGEVVTQSYNSLLTLSKLYGLTDTVCLHENDLLHGTCSKALSLTNVSFQDINSIIAQQLAATLQPVDNLTPTRLVSNLTSHENYKFVQILSTPHISKEHLKFETASSWAVLTNRIRNSIKNAYEFENLTTKNYAKLRCVANVLISRGNSSISEDDVKLVNDPLLYVPWVPIQGRLKHYHQPRTFANLNKYLVLITNNNYMWNAVRSISDDACSLFANGAYLHHYKKYDVDEQYFADAFNDLDTIIENYKKL